MSWVSTHGRLNMTHDFGPHGRLPGIKIQYVCIEAATVTPWNAVHAGVGACPGHYGTCISIPIKPLHLYVPIESAHEFLIYTFVLYMCMFTSIVFKIVFSVWQPKWIACAIPSMNLIHCEFHHHQNSQLYNSMDFKLVAVHISLVLLVNLTSPAALLHIEN